MCPYSECPAPIWVPGRPVFRHGNLGPGLVGWDSGTGIWDTRSPVSEMDIWTSGFLEWISGSPVSRMDTWSWKMVPLKIGPRLFRLEVEVVFTLRGAT
jgi:hypothetical protein